MGRTRFELGFHLESEQSLVVHKKLELIKVLDELNLVCRALFPCLKWARALKLKLKSRVARTWLNLDNTRLELKHKYKLRKKCDSSRKYDGSYSSLGLNLTCLIHGLNSKHKFKLNKKCYSIRKYDGSSA